MSESWKPWGHRRLNRASWPIILYYIIIGLHDLLYREANLFIPLFTWLLAGPTEWTLHKLFEDEWKKKKKIRWAPQVQHTLECPQRQQYKMFHSPPTLYHNLMSTWPKACLSLSVSQCVRDLLRNRTNCKWVTYRRCECVLKLVCMCAPVHFCACVCICVHMCRKWA